MCYELLDKVTIWQISINKKVLRTLQSIAKESAKGVSNVLTEAESSVLARDGGTRKRRIRTRRR
jgi:hypothetical protein